MADTTPKRDPIFDEADKYRDYFADDEKDLQELIKRLTKLQNISDKQIDDISAVAPGKGTQHYLIEHITNAIAIQNQLQSVLKDKRQIKEKSLEIALKNIDGDNIGDGNDILASLQRLIKEQKEKANKNAETLESKIENSGEEIDLDAEIEKKLGI